MTDWRKSSNSSSLLIVSLPLLRFALILKSIISIIIQQRTIPAMIAVVNPIGVKFTLSRPWMHEIKTTQIRMLSIMQVDYKVVLLENRGLMYLKLIISE